MLNLNKKTLSIITLSTSSDTLPASSIWRLTGWMLIVCEIERFTTITSASPEKYAAFQDATSPPPIITMRRISVFGLVDF
jgi:hypothetical protein